MQLVLFNAVCLSVYAGTGVGGFVSTVVVSPVIWVSFLGLNASLFRRSVLPLTSTRYERSDSFWTQVPASHILFC